MYSHRYSVGLSYVARASAQDPGPNEIALDRVLALGCHYQDVKWKGDLDVRGKPCFEQAVLPSCVCVVMLMKRSFHVDRETSLRHQLSSEAVRFAGA